MSFESSHEFKLPSELDPTKKDGKGGFLEGEIQLPLGVSEMMVTISTHPTFQFSPDKLARYGEDLKEFSPHLIYPVFKPKGQYLWDDMPMPFLQHWKFLSRMTLNYFNQLFHLISVTICSLIFFICPM